MPETYRAIAETETDAEAPLTSDLFKALDKNVAATVQGSNGAPVNEYGWHAYNKVTIGDSNTGRIWSFAIDGAVTLITSPDFADGYDYAFLLDRVIGPAVAQNIYIQYFRETSGAYAAAMNSQVSSGGSGAGVTGLFEMLNVRLTRTAHLLTGVANPHVLTDGSLGGGSINVNAVTTHTTRQKILRARIGLISGGSLSGTDAAIYMLRRRNILT